MEWAFVHVPKNGGTSMRSVLRGDFAHARPFKSMPHAMARKLRAHWGQRWDQAYTFGFTRNPWDRVVSLYHFRTHDKGVHPERFREWLLQATNGLTTHARALLPAWDMLYDEDGTQLVSYVGRYECIPEDFAHVCRELGRPSKRLPRANASRSPGQRAWWEYYDDELEAAVGRYYHNDVTYFGYRFSDGR